LTALVKLSPEDDRGLHRVTVRSLVRVVGKLYYASDSSTPVLHATYYRHFPRDEYVTTEARSYMLR
jgi:hypothetical protein